jgi:hypothetical protein
LLIDIQSAVEDTENVDRVVVRDYVRNAVVAVEQDADISVRICFVSVPAFREVAKNLDTFLYPKDDVPSGLLIVPRDVIIDLLEPGFRSSVHSISAIVPSDVSFHHY